MPIATPVLNSPVPSASHEVGSTSRGTKLNRNRQAKRQGPENVYIIYLYTKAYVTVARGATGWHAPQAIGLEYCQSDNAQRY